MKITKISVRISFICGLIILLIGIFMQVFCQSSEGYYYSIFGYGDNMMYSTTISGFAVIFIGILVLLLSIFFLYSYKQEKKELEKLE